MSTEKVSNQARLDRIEEKRAHELNLKTPKRIKDQRKRHSKKKTKNQNH